MTDTALTSTENNLSMKKSLTELKVAIKFHLNQMAGHAIEIGKLLIEAKEQVGHGEWGNWLEDNFNLSQESARRFMKCSERFGNSTSMWNLGTTQLMTMLVLPAGEEEKFIAEKTAEGKPPEDMKVKELREEVAKWKSDYEQKKSEVEDLFKEKSELEDKKGTFKMRILFYFFFFNGNTL